MVQTLHNQIAEQELAIRTTVRLSAQILFRCTFFSVFLLYGLFLMLYNLPIETNNNAPQIRTVGTPTDREIHELHRSRLR